MKEMHDPIDPVLRSNSLISSVGFYNLSKKVSNSSNLSTQSSKSSLNKRFTRDIALSFTSSMNKKNTRDFSYYDGDSEGATHSSISRFLSGRSFLKSKAKRPVQRPESPSSLKSPLSALSHDSESKTLSVLDLNEEVGPLPSSRGSRFNKQYASSLVGGESTHESKYLTPKTSRQAGLSLSSQNSNSTIVDSRLAAVFYFTQTDASEEVIKPNVESGKFLDLHKKYLAPAEQFIPSRQLKNSDEYGRSSSDGYRTDLIPNTRSFDTIFNKILEIVRPVLSPSRQITLPNGHKHVYLDSSQDRATRILKSQLINPNSEDEINSLRQAPSEKIQPRMKSVKVEDLTKLQVEELLEIIDVFFGRCITILAFDLNSRNEPLIILTRRNSFQGNDPSDNSFIVNKYLLQWLQIHQAWIYFRTKIRFTLINIFFDLQRELRANQEKRFNSRDSALFDMDVTLHMNFKDQFIIPQLKSRFRELDRQRRGQQTELLEAEKKFFKNDACQFGKTVTKILGIIASKTRVDYTSADEPTLDDAMFYDFHMWLDQITRP